jgi:ubiquinone/menaquinone biosynthesis C-methylase UbiE
MPPLLIALLAVLLLAGVGWLIHWLFIRTEGVFLGRRVVVWLYDLVAARYDDLKQFDADTESAFLGWPLWVRLRHRPSPLVLDVATGTGRLPCCLLAEPGFDGCVVGLDPSAPMLAQARAKLSDYGARALLVRGTAMRLPFEDATFDAVTCLEALEFLPDDAAALAEMARVLRPGGVLLTTRRQGPEAAYFLDRVHSREALEGLLANVGFVAIESKPWQVEYELVWARRGEEIGG